MNQARVDYANVEWMNAWLHHPVLGEPSWDTFERRAANPICRGKPPLEWPVNGFLLIDPMRGNWYVYVGNYPAGYAMNPGKGSTCTVWRSVDAGESWEDIGPIFEDVPFTFEESDVPMWRAPDVTVVYDNGRYHMLFDWVNEGAAWDTVRSEISGIGYAWSDCPEGPFLRSPVPVHRNDKLPSDPLFQKYSRLYASTLVRRETDWLRLSIIDSGPYFSWGLAGAIAKEPGGPYGEAVPLFHVEGDHFQPPLMEFFPSFVHDGWVYAPSTSVALNRNFQMLHRARLEDAMNSNAWEVVQSGSVWHGIQAEHEAWGIWGQTFSGVVDEANRFHVMFPSKDHADRGSINIAVRPWDDPYRSKGFCASGHMGPSLALLARSFEVFRLEATLELSGTATLLWGYDAPLGADAPKSNSTIHPWTLNGYDGLRLTDEVWEIVSLREDHKDTIASGALTEKVTRVFLDCRTDGSVALALNGRSVWTGSLTLHAGKMGFLMDKGSALSVNQFSIEGASEPANLSFIWTEGLLGAGQNLADWELVSSPLFRYGEGMVHRSDTGRAKWNFYGTGFSIWTPCGSDYGKADVLLDGVNVGVVDFSAESECASTELFSMDDLEAGCHAVVLDATWGRLVVDVFDVHTGA